uniref:Putative multiubiquitin chain binding n=1 Tax=Phaffia rhodozyma TaxID=264483 RepID=J7HAQ6_PHARH|nr:putative multiubiquitin chain binding [Phaffia rhodozyma]AFP98798.1 putative multiubiquitin chain binding [Phaffia rhodozyma]
MAPEAVMLLIDSSEYMRNGDFTPTRFEAQLDAISVIFNSKVNSNPENTVGVMTMGGAGGKGPEVLATPTNDLGKILSALHKATIGGESDLHTGIQVAQLALKHRQNKTQRQRIILLLGSPLSESASEKELVKLGKKLKKNNVAVDVVTFIGDSEADGMVNGEENGGAEAVLGRFVESVQSGENSHIITVPAGPHLLSDIIASSSILRGEDSYSGGGGGDGGVGGSGGVGGGSNFEFGVDPDMDPELAMVLRMSMEEEQARQARANGAESVSSAPLATVPETSSNAAPAEIVSESTALAPVETTSSSRVPAQETENEDDESDAELKAALALSSGADRDVEMGDEDEEDDEDEEEAIRKAIELSMQEDQEKK